MTRDKAIESLTWIKENSVISDEYKKAMDMAIESLTYQNLSKPNNTCEVDLISREDALMQARPEYLNPQQEKLASYNQGWNDAIDEYFDRIKEIPNCGAEGHLSDNYCPNCGTKMDKDGEREEK